MCVYIFLNVIVCVQTYRINRIDVDQDILDFQTKMVARSDYCIFSVVEMVGSDAVKNAPHLIGLYRLDGTTAFGAHSPSHLFSP